jgi:hypothetical protein
MGRLRGALALVCVLLCGDRAMAKDCQDSCGGDADCAREAGGCLVDGGRHLEAVALLKEAAAAHPADGSLARLLASAYLGSGNRVWAIKVLLAHHAAAPDDLQTAAWAAWLLMQEGALDHAEHLLESAEAPDGPDARRLELLAVILAQLREEEIEEGLGEVEKGGGKMYAEDIALLESLRLQVLGKHSQFLSARVLLSGGYTTNATQSAPQDVGTGQDAAGAGILSLDLVLRLEPWASALVRPLAEIRGKGFQPLGAEAIDFGYLSLGGRAGGEVGRLDGVRFRLLYGYELLGLMDRGWYMTAHRAEFELDIIPELQVFGGVGRRIYEHLPRTRTEMDLGAALVLALPGGWNLTWLVAGRLQFARHEAFDERGLTGLVRLKVPLPAGFMIKLRYMVLYDVFPDSAEYYNEQRPRKDLMLKTEAGVWTPAWLGFRIGVSYTLAHRYSTVDNLIDNFNYTDHRFLLQLRWEGSLDPTLPHKAKVGNGYLPLPYGLDTGGDTGLDRVQDLLRQEDSARRGSMCVD